MSADQTTRTERHPAVGALWLLPVAGGVWLLLTVAHRHGALPAGVLFAAIAWLLSRGAGSRRHSHSAAAYLLGVWVLAGVVSAIWLLLAGGAL